MREEERDLSFADFGNLQRPYTAPTKNGAGENLANPAEDLVELRGFEPLTFALRTQRSTN